MLVELGLQRLRHSLRPHNSLRDDSVARRECTWRLKVFFRSDDTSDVEPHVEHLLTT